MSVSEVAGSSGKLRVRAVFAVEIDRAMAIRSEAAASDPEWQECRKTWMPPRLTRMTHNARSLLQGGHLRKGVTLEAAADVLWTYSSPELYELLVIRRGWSAERYGQFIADSMIAALVR